MEIIPYTVLICITLGFVTVADDAVWNHPSLVMWRGDRICIIQSMMQNCVLAPVTPQEPKVLSHRAHGAPRVQPPVGPNLVGETIRSGCRWQRSVPLLLTSLSSCHRMLDVGEFSGDNPAFSTACVGSFPHKKLPTWSLALFDKSTRILYKYILTSLQNKGKLNYSIRL